MWLFVDLKMHSLIVTVVSQTLWRWLGPRRASGLPLEYLKQRQYNQKLIFPWNIKIYSKESCKEKSQYTEYEWLSISILIIWGNERIKHNQGESLTDQMSNEPLLSQLFCLIRPKLQVHTMRHAISANSTIGLFTIRISSAKP